MPKKKKKKKNKGFSLVELIATIVILSIIILIAVPSYIGVSNTVKEKNYQNKIDYLTSKALEYATDNNIENKTISVNTLLYEGYISPDKDNDKTYEQIANPLGGYFDCDLIEIRKEDGDYVASYSKENNCDVASIESLSSNIEINVYKVSDLENPIGKNNSVNWTNEDIIFFVSLGDLELDSNNPTITYSSSGSTLTKTGNLAINPNSNVDNYINLFKVDALVFLDTTYQVSVNTTNGLITQNVKVKIDKETPYAKAQVSKELTNNNQTITYMGSDGTGSGIKNYYITTNKDEVVNINSFSKELDKIDEYYAKQTINGNTYYQENTYYIYAIDNVGNISKEPYELIIANIDVEGPKCSVIPDNTSWSETYTFTYGCDGDNKSGCKTENKTYTMTSGGTYETFSWIVEDNLGNKTQCSQSVKKMIDKTAPTCTHTNSFSSWTNSNRTVSWGCSDSESGCKVTNVNSVPITSSTKTYTIPSYTIYDNAGNSTTCQSTTINVYVDKNAPTCVSASGYSSWTSSSRTISWGCNDTGGSGCTSGSSGSKTFSSTTTTYPLSSRYVYDNAGNSTYCSSQNVGIYVDKTNPTCTVSGSTSGVGSVTLTGTCSDSNSGCRSSSVSKSRSSSGYLSPGTVYDNVGNSATCSSKYVTIKTPSNFSKSTPGTYTYNVEVSGTYRISVYGAQGGSTDYAGGYGGYARADFYLSAGQTLGILVGGKGGNASSYSNTGGSGGTGGGGRGGNGASSGCGYNRGRCKGGGGGGGASFVAKNRCTSLSSCRWNILVIAGGGGGAGAPGAASPGLTGGKGTGCDNTSVVYSGRVNSAVGCSSTPPTIGSSYSYGNGQNGRSASSFVGCGGEGTGGGGGGYLGGGAQTSNGANSVAGGGGGTGYISGGSNTTCSAGSKSGNGSVSITYVG